MRRIVASYRRKILTVYPKAQFNEEFMLGCTLDQLAAQIEREFQPGMSWNDYGKNWVVCNVRPRAGLNFADPAVFYAYFRHDQLVAVRSDALPSWLKNLRKDKTSKPQGFSAPGLPEGFARDEEEG